MPPAPALPVGPLPEADQARLALREVQRRLSKNEAPLQLVTLPGVHALSAFTRFIDGGRERFIEIVQLAVLNNEPVACRWWDIYRELPSYPRSIVSFDDVCAASNVKPKELILVLISTAIDVGIDVGNWVAAAMHPKIVERLAASATRIEGEFAEIGYKDRQSFLQSRVSSFLPLPKGAVSVHVNASANVQAAAAAANEPTVPSFAADLGARPARPVALPALPAPDPDLTLIDAAAREGILVGEGD